MDNELSPELRSGLLMLCKELEVFLNQSASSLFVAQEYLKQVHNVIKPWEISNKNIPELKKCICKTLSDIQVAQNTAFLNTLSRITELREKTKQLNKVPSGVNPNMKSLAQPVQNIYKNKQPVLQNVRKCTSVQTTSTNNSPHSPCCPLYKTNFELNAKQLQSSMSLSDALELYKIPSVLYCTIKNSKKIICGTDKVEDINKNMFIQKLDAQNKEYNTLYETNSFLSYVHSLNNYIKMKYKKIDADPWILYKNVEDIETLQTSRFNIITKESWATILNCINYEFIPLLETSKLDKKQKLYLIKILKTISNFVNSTIPDIPIFKVQSKVGT